MHMIPDTPHGTFSKAERLIFDKLRTVSFNEKNGIYTAFHSLNLTKHDYKRFGEIDFLITGPSGILALEVKGGRIACINGVWECIDRYGKIHRKVEGPFKQVESALHGLMKNLRANLPMDIVDKFYIGFGVITPDQHWKESGAEWDEHTLAGARGCKRFKDWLQNLFQYWKDQDMRERQPDKNALSLLNHYLRPNFETVVPLYVLAWEVEDRVTRLTNDQMVMVDVAHANQRVLCPGGAGTGKTFLAKELARRWTATGMNVILVCHSPFLKHYLEANFSIPKLTVSLVDGAGMACKRKGLEYFDALIVDEGQDIFNMDSLYKMDSVIKGGLIRGRWCFFHDMNNQSRLIGRFEDEAFEYLNLLKSAEVPLRTNCRNTEIILETVKKTLGADMGVRGAGKGPAIRRYINNRDGCARILAKEMVELIDHGGLAPGDVTILSPLRYADSCVTALPKHIREKILVLDEYAIRSFPLNKISFATVKDFKGLENEAVIIVDMPLPDPRNSDLSMHYVAMSRPRAILSLIYQDTEQSMIMDKNLLMGA